MSRHWKGPDHHLWVPNTNVAFLAFSQPRDKYLTLSNNLGMRVTELLNNRLLRSFHNTQAQISQMSWIKERLALPPHVEWTNCKKWSNKMWESTPRKPIRSRTSSYKDAKVVHVKNKCCAVSSRSHPETHEEAWEEMTLLDIKFDLVGNLSRSSRHTKTKTFKESWLCPINSAAEFARGISFVVNKWYAPRTE